MESIIEIFKDGVWIPTAELRHMEGHRALFDYLPTYQFGDDPVPISLAMPVFGERVGVGENGVPICPAFMFDLVPQGLGRKYLLQELSKADGDGMDIPLAQIGAFNPIGNLRLDTAVRYFDRWREQHADTQVEGFTQEQIVSRHEPFVNHIWLHAMLTAGTTGVQGAAPKFLLTQNQDGLWFADSALEDRLATKHWLVKLPRGKTQADLDVLRIEAIYFAIAKDCGLRTHGECYTSNNMLFIERFDRMVNPAQGKVIRLHQESLLSVAGISGFPGGVSLFTLANTIARYATDPAKELTEFIKRELMNRAMGNTDNHGRNTAMQCLPDGTIQLTPLYDFAPMFMDPEVVARSCRWIRDGLEFDRVEDIIAQTDTTDEVRQHVRGELDGFYDVLSELPVIMKRNELDQSVIERLHYNIEAAKGMLRG
ncbi:serine/threonine-protein kinase HipA [Methylobacillus rhizosphaerae]|uniref:Serine/threonine-protein kinase HipA n=1 Tax=Methylobacillus rhizosphaerae TaxID=551994 RepID=A0A238ZNY5_9PROT|nr:HipA domain-containing protein [Methylobacillus rhizosphaerae]SNR84383.1 serine/threonine-protein kinase HipA [Methylobacillus rhizosphaerae]